MLQSNLDFVQLENRGESQRQKPKELFTVSEISKVIGAEEDIEVVFKIIEHLVASQNHKISKTQGRSLFDCKYGLG